jgi:ribosomal protein S18 acetylase RimI-like enzyme
MIFLLSKIIKDKLKKKLKEKHIKYNKEIYKYYFDIYVKKISNIIKTFADTINEKYIDLILNSNNIDIILYGINNNFNIKNIIGFIIFSKTGVKQDKIYLLLICIQKEYREYGYGKSFIGEFIDFINKSLTFNNKYKQIITHSICKSIEFYKSTGFIQITNNIHHYKKIFEFEKYNKNAIILIYYNK